MRHGTYTTRTVSFPSNGADVNGLLFLPEGQQDPVPAVTILGPYCYVKEQAPLQYAARLADEGFASVAFDPRHHGASPGAPRRYEDPERKIADARACLDFLADMSEVDSSALYALGICDGAAEMLHLAGRDQRVRALAAVTGHYRDHDNDLAVIGGEALLRGEIGRGRAEELWHARAERGAKALAAYQADGTVEYLPIVDPERTDVALPLRMAWEWYQGWAVRGLWENRYAVMSDVPYLAFESMSAAGALDKPLLMIHGEYSDGPAAARRHFDAVPGTEKMLIWEEDISHFNYYDDPVTLDRAAGDIASWFRETR